MLLLFLARCDPEFASAPREQIKPRIWTFRQVETACGEITSQPSVMTTLGRMVEGFKRLDPTARTVGTDRLPKKYFTYRYDTAFSIAVNRWPDH